jgi:hypothetical protein
MKFRRSVKRGKSIQRDSGDIFDMEKIGRSVERGRIEFGMCGVCCDVTPF